MDLSKYKEYLAPRYWLALLGILLILLGLTGGTEVAGVDVRITDPIKGYLAMVLGVIACIYAAKAHKSYVKRSPDPND